MPTFAADCSDASRTVRLRYEPKTFIESRESSIFRRLVVDGAASDIASTEDGTSDYEWLTGPSDGHGVRSPPNWGGVPTDKELEESIRNFLANVDPRTGFIEGCDRESQGCACLGTKRRVDRVSSLFNPLLNPGARPFIWAVQPLLGRRPQDLVSGIEISAAHLE